MPVPAVLIDSLAQPVAMRADPDGSRPIVALRNGHLGGVAERGITGYGTEFEYFEAHVDGGGWATGRVIRSDTHQGVSGAVLVSVMPYDLDDPTPEVVVNAELDYDGYFSLEFLQPELRGRAQASYPGWYAFAPCESRVVEL